MKIVTSNQNRWSKIDYENNTENRWSKKDDLKLDDLLCCRSYSSNSKLY